MLLSTLLKELDYEQSVHYRSHVSEFEPETAHLFRAARDAGVSGIYVFQTSPATSQKVVVDRPAVFIAQARDLKHAQSIHRSLWNLGYAPFLIVLLPEQVRVYSGFKYSEEDPQTGFLDEFQLNDLRILLAEFSAEAIDTGHIWQKSKYKKQLDQQQRVDKLLLKNLRQLGDELKKQGLDASIAHALIGKYVYIRYLWDRGILTEEWLQEQHIEKTSVFSRVASTDGLSRFTTALENRFNGKIFPIDFTRTDAPTDLHVRLTASVFMGDEIILGRKKTIIEQLHLDFRAYDFAYIPIEILSEVYEQFIEDSKKKGAVYTPEILADYLLSEINTVKPLNEETKILDPACGSGVFLVLAYRWLIEAELAKEGKSKLSHGKLEALLSNIYGVERELDACYVAEFSLILTLLNYVDPRELQKIEFHFPTLHNVTIFHSDFFDVDGTHYDGKFWQRGLTFDWIIGNPPWIELKDDGKEDLVRKWMQDPINKFDRPISGKRVAEAFSWLVTDLLQPEGIVGLLLPATSLFILEGRNYRRRFFASHRVFRITNFSNLRWILFPKYELQAVNQLKGKTIFRREAMRKSLRRFSVPRYVLSDIPDEMCYIRVQGGDVGLQLTQAPHIVLSPGWGSYVTFSDVDFLIPPRVMGIAGPQEDADMLRALSLYLNSSLISYYLFFHVPEWGVFRNARYVRLSELRKVPVPDFSPAQVEELVALHQNLIDAEEQIISEALAKVQSLQMELLNSNQSITVGTISVLDLLSKASPEQRNQVKKEVAAFHTATQKVIDEKIFDLFNIPDDI